MRRAGRPRLRPRTPGGLPPGELPDLGPPEDHRTDRRRPVQPDLPPALSPPATWSCANSRAASCCLRPMRSTASSGSSRPWPRPTCRCRRCCHLCTDRSILGTFFYVMEALDGRVFHDSGRARGRAGRAGRPLRRHERRPRPPPPGRLAGGRPGGLRQARQLFRPPDRPLDPPVAGLQDPRDPRDRAADRLAAGQPAFRRRGDHHRPRRLSPRQPDVPPDRAAGDRHPRLGALDPRPPALRPGLQLPALARVARRCTTASKAST